MTTSERLAVMSAIEAEPEYPGELPPALALALDYVIASGDRRALVEALRISVRLTKQGIAKRMKSVLGVPRRAGE